MGRKPKKRFDDDEIQETEVNELVESDYAESESDMDEENEDAELNFDNHNYLRPNAFYNEDELFD